MSKFLLWKRKIYLFLFREEFVDLFILSVTSLNLSSDYYISGWRTPEPRTLTINGKLFTIQMSCKRNNLK
ncbi:CLUMA_CG019253, isoform A [Clunio marinus]|uniref:CLUMA_CG019253, isoform A n=1 Tax=Clunio marinus TaxID=568069 RepID=A0A1J1J3A0_9DIPT|nr:CLUMA_CG019253, isoform A [Clunio marinus]